MNNSFIELCLLSSLAFTTRLHMNNCNVHYVINILRRLCVLATYST